MDLRVSVGQPVDQTVEDVDPLATSLRRVEPGNALYSDRIRIYEFGPPSPLGMDRSSFQRDPATGLAMPQQYRYVAPGVQAWLNRPDYLVRTGPDRRDIGFNVAPYADGAFVEVVPPGTVFDLIPRPQILARPTPLAEETAFWPDQRLDARLDLRLNTRVDLRLGAAPANAPLQPVPQPMNTSALPWE